MRIENEGQIRSIELPNGWTERQIERQPLVSQTMRSFHSGESDAAQIRFVYRGHAESGELGNRFRSCLSAPAHALDKSEINSLAEVLAEVGEPAEFNVIGAQTMDLQNKRVLWVEGTWVDSPYWTGTLFIDADGTGRMIQEICCFAELKSYESMAAVFQNILASLTWK